VALAAEFAVDELQGVEVVLGRVSVSGQESREYMSRLTWLGPLPRVVVVLTGAASAEAKRQITLTRMWK